MTTATVPAAVREATDRLLSAIEAAGVQGASAVLYGSAARGDWHAAHSDINLLLVVEALPPATLRALAGPLSQWRAAHGSPPILATRAEWRTAEDSFPLELADMHLARVVLRGPDPVEGHAPARADVRRALERELRVAVLQLRRGYVAHAADPEALARLAAATGGPLLAVLRLLLQHVGEAVPPAAEAVIARAAARVPFDAEAVLAARAARDPASRAFGAEAFERYLAAVEAAAAFIDGHHPGDA
ncbi:MAG: nucleotidyltransferase domain-containing protein [Gemmatimonadales bacterium]|nr:nucleotidyltransferase domain-containing protein [Gemmatimonadales bacterium]